MTTYEEYRKGKPISVGEIEFIDMYTSCKSPEELNNLFDSKNLTEFEKGYLWGWTIGTARTYTLVEEINKIEKVSDIQKSYG